MRKQGQKWQVKKKGRKLVAEIKPKRIKLPSEFQPNDPVFAHLGGHFIPGHVYSVTFTEGAVFYAVRPETGPILYEIWSGHLSARDATRQATRMETEVSFDAACANAANAAGAARP